jgi:hypothetical protein
MASPLATAGHEEPLGEPTTLYAWHYAHYPFQAEEGLVSLRFQSDLPADVYLFTAVQYALYPPLTANGTNREVEDAIAFPSVTSLSREIRLRAGQDYVFVVDNTDYPGFADMRAEVGDQPVAYSFVLRNLNTPDAGFGALVRTLTFQSHYELPLLAGLSVSPLLLWGLLAALGLEVWAWRAGRDRWIALGVLSAAGAATMWLVLEQGLIEARWAMLGLALVLPVWLARTVYDGRVLVAASLATAYWSTALAGALTLYSQGREAILHDFRYEGLTKGLGYGSTSVDYFVYPWVAAALVALAITFLRAQRRLDVSAGVDPGAGGKKLRVVVRNTGWWDVKELRLFVAALDGAERRFLVTDGVVAATLKRGHDLETAVDLDAAALGQDVLVGARGRATRSELLLLTP